MSGWMRMNCRMKMAGGCKELPRKGLKTLGVTKNRLLPNTLCTRNLRTLRVVVRRSLALE